MSTLIVVEDPKQWPLEIPNTEVVAANTYLTSRRFVDLRGVKVLNLCRAHGYQSVGYYVSLLAMARGHKPLPTVTTVNDLRHTSVLRIVSDDLEDSLQRMLENIKGEHFELSIYFGKNLAKRYDRLAQTLFNHFPAPFLRAEFVWADQWRLQRLRPISSSEIPESHRAFVIDQTTKFIERPRITSIKRARYDLAILYDPKEVDSPSCPRAIDKFAKAAKKLGMSASIIDRTEYGRIGEYDALFIRETTFVNHHTYRFARRAASEGLVVIDDPESIVRCTNKVYQAELLDRAGIPTPKTIIAHGDNAHALGPALGFPVVLKRPDSSFSAGVVKADDPAELDARLEEFFEKSELVVAQEYVPSEFDWRIGVLDGKPLYACRYFMAKGHWQIQKATGEGRSYGKVQTLPVYEAPRAAVRAAVRSANLIGRGFYGVDLKQIGDRFLVMEINDNPSVEVGYEDAHLKDELYLAIMRVFYERLERRGTREEIL